MKIIRTITLYLALAFSLVLLWKKVLYTPCSYIIEYDIGIFDERFEIEKEVFLAYIELAEAPWEYVVGKELFQYVPGSDFKINLIWSEDQERLYKGNDLESSLDSTQESLFSLQDRYQLAVDRYERTLAGYESDLSTYDADVSYWNNQGGAPSEEYNALQLRADDLDKKADELSILLSQVNNLADENNQKLENYNSGVNEYNDLFDQGHEFDAGNTDGTEINVYSYDGLRELQTLLIHEFGHVLGVDHVDDERSVMYYLLNSKNQNGELSETDISSIELSCKLK